MQRSKQLEVKLLLLEIGYEPIDFLLRCLVRVRHVIAASHRNAKQRSFGNLPVIALDAQLSLLAFIVHQFLLWERDYHDIENVAGENGAVSFETERCLAGELGIVEHHRAVGTIGYDRLGVFDEVVVIGRR